jgi:hypothetical protein
MTTLLELLMAVAYVGGIVCAAVVLVALMRSRLR